MPQFSGRLAAEGEASAKRFAVEVLSVLVTVLFVFVTLLQIFMPLLMYVFAPGFADQPVKFNLAIELSRLTFPYLLFISLVSLLGGVLNSLGRFAAAAATPIVLNLALIGALLGATPFLPTPGHALAWGVAAAGIGQFLWMVIACQRAGVQLYLPRPRFTPAVKRMLRLMVPGAIGAGVVQINLLIDTMIASILPTGAVSFLYYADRINELPVGVIGIAVGTALLPVLARQIRTGEEAAAHYSMNRALEFALFLTVPAAAALIVIAEPVIAVLFQRGAFGAHEAAATGDALKAFSLGLPAYVLVKVLGPGFFAREDTATPVKIAIVCVVANVAVSLTLIQFLAHVGIALATATTAWLNAGMMWSILHRRGHYAIDARLRTRAIRILAAAAGMAGALWVGLIVLDPWLVSRGPVRWIALGVLVAGGALVYGALVLALRAAEPADIARLLPRRFRRSAPGA